VPFNDIEFTYQEPKTFGAFYYNKLNNREYGSVKASDGTQSGRDPRLNRGQDYRVELPFEKMFFERLNDSNDESESQIGYGFFVDDNQAATVGKPLMFFKSTIYLCDFTFQTDLFNTTEDHNIEFVIETTETSLAVSYSLSCTKTISTLGETPDEYTISAGTIEPGNIVETLYVSQSRSHPL